MKVRPILSVIMASHSNRQLDVSVTDHFSPSSPYNVVAIPGRAATRSQVHLHDIQGLRRYRGNNHPILSAERKVIIEEKLKLDEKVRGELGNRLKDENYFAKYHRNPFSFTQNVAPSPSDLLEEQQRRKRRGKNMQERHFVQTTKENIVEAVNQLKRNDFFRDVSPLQNNIVYSKMASLMLNNASESQLSRPARLVRDSKEEALRSEVTIDDIVGMQDQNFYAANIGRIDIFQVMRGTHRPFLTRQKLDKYRFSFMHIVQRINATKVPFLRELSRLGRELMHERTAKKYDRIQYVSSAEMAVQYGEINLGDLLSLASGRFSPEIAYAAANEGDVRKDFSPNSSEIGQVQILYNSRARHKQHNCQNVSQERNQIRAYQYIENTPEQAKCDRFCGKFQAKIREDLQLRTKLLGNTIRDRSMHGKIEASVQENMAYLANMNRRRKGTSTDRLISQNKVNKDRKERLQIKHLLQSIQLKNRDEDRIRQLLNP